MSDGKRIVLGEDDFDDAPAPQPPPAAAPGPSLPPLSSTARIPVNAGGVPAGAGSPSRLLYDAKTGPLIAAAAAMFIGWAISEIIGLPEFRDSSETTQESTNVNTGVYIMGLSLMFGAIMLTWDQLLAKEWESALREAARAAIPLLAAGFVVGYLSNRFYASLLSGDDPSESLHYISRGIAWGMFGAAFGGVLGIVRKSKPLAINGLLGGTLGGIAGGVAFQFVTSNMDLSEVTSRLIGMLFVALAIAFALRLIESARREAWLSVVAGGMTGKEFILYHEVTRIGSSPKCEIFIVKDPSVAGMHANIAEVGNVRTLTAEAGASVNVNGSPVAQKQLREGDQIQIGNTTLAYSERTAA